MAYDENGNLKKDLDRDIVTIRYNLLNLPDTIQFKNGNVIINHYSADGQKQRSDNYTRLTAITPVGENTVVNPENGYNDAVYSYTGTAYISGFEYGIYKTKNQGYGGVWYYYDVFTANKIYTPEGYIDYLNSNIVSNGVRYNYYRKDHLGNIHEVWNGVRKNYYNQVKEAASTRQRTQYYPSGLPWASNSGDNAGIQNRKYNGKEWIEMHGYDVSDLGWRGLHNAKFRFDSFDPDAELDYDISPYAACHNNPVLKVDPNGRWVETAWDVVSLGMGVSSLVSNIKQGKVLDAVVDGVGVVVDAVATVAPLIPAGAGAAIKAIRAGDKVVDAVKEVKTTEKVVEGANIAKKTHGNKLDGKPAEGYTLRDKKTGEVQKYGETTRGEDKFGAGNQKRYTKKELKEKDVYYQKETSGTKKEMHKWQNENIKEYKSNNNGYRPKLNKSDY